MGMQAHDNAQFVRDYEELIGTPPKDMAFTGAYDGAARFDKQISTWSPPLQSADAEMIPAKATLDARARDMGRNDAYVQGGTQLRKDAIVGSMYMLNAKPNRAVLGWDQARVEAFQLEAEAKFQLWADSPHKWVDAARQNDLTEMIRLAVGVSVYGGEVLATVEWSKSNKREFQTMIQMIDPDRLHTPYDQMHDPNVRGGLRHNRFGERVSAFIRTTHPSDYRMRLVDSLRYKEVGFVKPWGRPQVLHIREQKRVDQTRAISDLASSLRELAITRQFRDVTLQNAVVNATYAASIESELPSEVVFAQMGASSASAGNQIADYAEDYLAGVGRYVNASKGMNIDGVKVPHLYPGTKLNMSPAGTPGGVGQEFEQSLIRYVAASLNVSYEELSRDYSNTNYSSARAAMLQTWRFMQSQKKIVADEFANTVWRLWLEEAVNKNMLESFPASEAGTLYTKGHLNMMFDALSQADWIGAARGQIDELKETQAAVLRIKYGLSTHEDELSRLGKDWRKVFEQKEREQADMEAKGIVLLEDNSVNAARGTPREQEEDGTDADEPKQ